ncbi:MAG: D-aminoacyl-tRNA deacylase [Candidatus Hydrogenedentes bacterium]|nr:D-aminoacyl-tRNA deacylase [Candidatus Hydrogenedentota bacterium]
MRAVIQRVRGSSVTVEGKVIGAIDNGLLVLLGVSDSDSEIDAEYLADKIAGLRCFSDEAGKFNLSLLDIRGSILAVSQFTLFGDCRKGKRPSFTGAARPELAVLLYEAFVKFSRERGVHVETGEFGAHMEVHLVNDGPVTLMLDSKKEF